MTKNLILDPEQVVRLEPSEQSERSKAMLSPFAVPQSFSVQGAGDAVKTIRFGYSGGETGGTFVALDGDSDPKIAVCTSETTQKILELQFDPPVRPAQLRQVSARLERRAESIEPRSKRLSYLMIGRILSAMVGPTLEDLARASHD